MVAVGLKQGQGSLRRAARGASFVARGILAFGRRRWAWPLGIVPIVIALVALVAIVVLSWVGVAAFGAWVVAWVRDAFAGRASPAVLTAAGLLALIAAASGVALAGVLLFAEAVKAIGQPFWKEMSGRLEDELGGPPAVEGRGRFFPALRDTVVLFLLWLAIAAPLLVLALVPVIGQTVVPAAEAVLAAWVLATELTQIPLDRRGLGPMARHRFLAAHRAETIGFGLAALALFLVPLANVLALPGVLLGGTLLVRHLEGEPSGVPEGRAM